MKGLGTLSDKSGLTTAKGLKLGIHSPSAQKRHAAKELGSDSKGALGLILTIWYVGTNAVSVVRSRVIQRPENHNVRTKALQ